MYLTYQTIFLTLCVPQLIQLLSYRRQRTMYFKGHLGLENCCISVPDVFVTRSCRQGSYPTCEKTIITYFLDVNCNTGQRSHLADVIRKRFPRRTCLPLGGEVQLKLQCQPRQQRRWPGTNTIKLYLPHLHRGPFRQFLKWSYSDCG